MAIVDIGELKLFTDVRKADLPDDSSAIVCTMVSVANRPLERGQSMACPASRPYLIRIAVIVGNASTSNFTLISSKDHTALQI
jgi:hypothetical protein